MQVDVHLLPPHDMVPQAALPLQVSTHFELEVPLQNSEAHAFDPVHVRVQSPVPHVRLPQTCAPLPPEHVSVQLPLVHETAPHAAEPMHSTLQSLVPHVIELHAFCPPQWIVHLLAASQLTMGQAPDVEQVMSQFQPVGQRTVPAPVPVRLHVVVARSHELHVDGHASESSNRASAGRVPMTQ